MKNYNRYSNTTSEEYDKKTLMSYLCRIPSNRTLIPLLAEIKNKSILDVGLGTGSYTKICLQHNSVTGIDQNPHMCKLPLKVHKGDATELAKLTGDEKFDIILSTWMTEYLNKEQLIKFFEESKKILCKDGQLITTIISSFGLGAVYITMAKLKGISKFNYSKKLVLQLLKDAGFKDIRIINLNSWLCIPWAYLVITR